MRIRKAIALILMVMLVMVMLPGTSLAATTFSPQSASGSYPIPARQYYCYLSGTSEYFHAEMTYTNNSPLIGFNITATLWRGPGDIQTIFIMDESGQESISKSESLLSIYVIQGFFATKAMGAYYVGAHRVADLTIH